MVRLRALARLIASSLVLLSTSSVRAQTDAAPCPEGTEGCVQIEPTAQSGQLTRGDLATFASIVNASESVASQRLASDPGLEPLAADAVRAYVDRKATGKSRVFGGAALFVLGDIVGSLIIVTTPGYPTVKSEDSGRVLGGLLVALAGMGLGAAIGIPGALKMARPSEAELAVRQRYRQAPAAQGSPAAPYETTSRAPSVVVPVLALDW